MGLRAIAVAVVLLTSVAYADEKPWAVGVSQQEQDEALRLFQSANGLFLKDEWAKALEVYVKALGHWDHPNIRFNAAVCLMKLDRKVEAYENMTAALRFGEAPLGKDLFTQGQAKLAELKGEVAHVHVECEKPDTKVTLDGETLEKCPDTKLVTPGKHLVLGEKQGYKAFTKEVIAPKGGTESVMVALELEGTRKLVRRWARWKPWAVVSAGTALSLGGVGFYLYANQLYQDHKNAVNDACGIPDMDHPNSWCEKGDSRISAQDDKLDKAKRWGTISYATLAVGATGVGIGVLLLILNQPHYATTVTPMPDADRGGLSLTTEW
jgi:hypothetical protein